MIVYDITGINPEPWTPGHAVPLRRGGKMIAIIVKDAKLKAFQMAVKEELPLQNGHAGLHSGDLTVRFYLWRSTAAGQPADATNCQKALEDALQGELYENDRSNRDIRTVIMEQGPTVMSHIRIEIEEFSEEGLPKLPAISTIEPFPEDGGWSPPEKEMF